MKLDVTTVIFGLLLFACAMVLTLALGIDPNTFLVSVPTWGLK